MRTSATRPIRVWVVGFGTVGQWLVRALNGRGLEFRERYGLSFEVVGLANRRDGFVYREHGIDAGAALAQVAAGNSLRELEGVGHWPSALDGLRATEADVLVETSASPAPSGEPGRAHLAHALERSIPAVTSNKWPLALHGLELIELARGGSTSLRAESTVMSGTPVVRALTDGLAGAVPTSLRGVLNATANFILTEIDADSSYADALAEAQRAGLAERDPSADVDGHDAVAKLMILASLVLGRQLTLEQVDRRGISSVTEDQIDRARSAGLRIRELATLDLSVAESATARIEPTALSADDPLARVDGSDNAVICRAEPLGEITVIGPGAGIELAGQGVLSDLIDVGRRARGT